MFLDSCDALTSTLMTEGNVKEDRLKEPNIKVLIVHTANINININTMHPGHLHASGTREI